MKPVWVVDDDRSIRWVLEKTLSREGIPFKSFASATEAISQLEQGAEPREVAEAIVHACERRKDVIYVRSIWRLIMLIIGHIPERIFKGMKI